MTLSQRLREPGPKRLLALDGGGIRGLISLGYLARIEAILRQRHHRPDLVLSDYFDLIGGTSTGAIIATVLALGWPVAEIRKWYLTFADQAFRPRKSLWGPLGRILGAKFDAKPLEELLEQGLADKTLDSEDLQVGLMVIAKRADTGSVWVLSNVPGQRFYEFNRKITLREIVRSSTAAPTFFDPSVVSDVGNGEEAVFVDGGVSMHANPALQLLMVAKLKGFGLEWPWGEDRLLLCSVGTGAFLRLEKREVLKKYDNLHWLALMITQMIKDASELNQTVLQWMSDSPTARQIDLQIEKLEPDHLAHPRLISYLRYDIDLEVAALEQVGVHFSAPEVEQLHNMSEVRNVPQLDEIGQAAAQSQVSDGHFPQVFDRQASP